MDLKLTIMLILEEADSMILHVKILFNVVFDEAAEALSDKKTV